MRYTLFASLSQPVTDTAIPDAYFVIHLFLAARARFPICLFRSRVAHGSRTGWRHLQIVQRMQALTPSEFWEIIQGHHD